MEYIVIDGKGKKVSKEDYEIDNIETINDRTNITKEKIKALAAQTTKASKLFTIRILIISHQNLKNITAFC